MDADRHHRMSRHVVAAAAVAVVVLAAAPGRLLAQPHEYVDELDIPAPLSPVQPPEPRVDAPAPPEPVAPDGTAADAEAVTPIGTGSVGSRPASDAPSTSPEATLGSNAPVAVDGGDEADRLTNLVSRIGGVDVAEGADSSEGDATADKQEATTAIDLDLGEDEEKSASPATAAGATLADSVSEAGEQSGLQTPLFPNDGSGDTGGVAWLGDSSILNVLAALGVVIVLILALRKVVAKFTGRPIGTKTTPVLEVLSRVSIAPKSNILLVRIGGRILVVGESGGGLSILSEIEEPEEIASLLRAIQTTKPGSVSREFSEMLEGLEDAPDGTSASDKDSAMRSSRARDEVTGLRTRIRSMMTERGVA